MAFPHVDAEVEYWDAETPDTPGVIETLDGTLADIRISAERLEEGVEMETQSSHPIRGYRKAP